MAETSGQRSSGTEGRLLHKLAGVVLVVILVPGGFVIGGFAASAYSRSLYQESPVSRFQVAVELVLFLLPMVLATAISGIVVHPSARKITVWVGVILSLALPVLMVLILSQARSS